MSTQPPVPPGPGSGDQPWQGQNPHGQPHQPQPQPHHPPQPGAYGNPYQQPPAAPQWGGSGRGESGGGNFFKALFDFSFQNYITLTFAKVIYGIALVLLVLGWLIYIVFGFTVHVGAGFAALLFGWIPVFLYLIFVRVGLETAVASVRADKQTRELKNR